MAVDFALDIRMQIEGRVKIGNQLVVMFFSSMERQYLGQATNNPVLLCFQLKQNTCHEHRG